MMIIFFSLYLAKSRTDLYYRNTSFPMEAMKNRSPAATSSILDLKRDSSNGLEYKRKLIFINYLNSRRTLRNEPKPQPLVSHLKLNICTTY